MKKSPSILRAIMLLCIITFSLASCVKQDYDQPDTANVDPNLKVTHSIRDIRNMATIVPKAITTDIIIAGIITADDESGAFYKEMIIQDSTGAMSVQLDVSNYNSSYPIGRRVFIKCKGLYIGDDGEGNIELGSNSSGTIGRIPGGAVQEYIYPGKWGLQLPLSIVGLDYLVAHPTDFTQKLVQFPSVEFSTADAGIAFGGDPLSSSDNSRILKDCAGNTLSVYTSAYANFASTKTPFRNGSLTGILKLYRGAGELLVRSIGDVKMNNLRCDGSTGIPQYIPLDSVRLLDPGTATATLPSDKFIRVIVTNDYNKVITNAKNMYCQDQTAGIQIRFTGNQSFPLGTELEINVSGLSLSNYLGVLQISNVPLSSATVVTPATFSIAPRITTIADINTNYTAWEGELVQLNNVTLSGNATYSGSNTITDGNGATIVLYTATGATFSGDALPASASKITGILIEYNGTKEIIIRDPAIDVVP